MIPLPEILKKNGFTYSQVLRKGNLCIYEQRVTEILNSYEVFIIKIKSVKILQGKIIPERESFHSNEDFGKTAWSCSNYNAAQKKFQALKNRNLLDITNIKKLKPNYL